MRVELIYDLDCPNVKMAREQLLTAFARVKLSCKWQEWERNDPAAPDYAHRYGSPTILINGKDIIGILPSDNNCCRLYLNESGTYQKVPTVESIINALLNHSSHRINNAQQRRLKCSELFVMLPTFSFALLPKLACPACWPAYTALLTSLGITFVNYTPYLFPLTTLFLLITLSLLAFRASLRRGYNPFLLGSLASLIIMIGKFSFDSNLALYAGILLLIIASIWNSWPRRKPYT